MPGTLNDEMGWDGLFKPTVPLRVLPPSCDAVDGRTGARCEKDAHEWGGPHEGQDPVSREWRSWYQ